MLTPALFTTGVPLVLAAAGAAHLPGSVPLLPCASCIPLAIPSLHHSPVAARWITSVTWASAWHWQGPRALKDFMSKLEKLGSLLKKKSNEIQHSYPEGSNDAQLFYCLVQVRHFREYILSFNEPTAEGPEFISAARILSLFQVRIIFLYFHLSLFLGCVYLKCLSLSLQLLSSFYRCLCSPQEFLNLPSPLPLTAMGKPWWILVFLCIPSEERETFPSKINILPWQVGARLGPLCGGKWFRSTLHIHTGMHAAQRKGCTTQHTALSRAHFCSCILSPCYRWILWYLLVCVFSSVLAYIISTDTNSWYKWC